MFNYFCLNGFPRKDINEDDHYNDFFAPIVISNGAIPNLNLATTGPKIAWF